MPAAKYICKISKNFRVERAVKRCVKAGKNSKSTPIVMLVEKEKSAPCLVYKSEHPPTDREGMLYCFKC
jgi:hypothetical protein